MKNHLLILTLLAALTTPIFAEGGPLTPPPGVPAPTMKSLDIVEPRTAITSLPYEINASGSYYLTGPLFSTTSGITVNASDVTVDLMGFTISGLSSPTHHGIFVAGGSDVELSNVVIRNGGITNFGYGILVHNTRGGEISGIISHQNALDGIRLLQINPGMCTDFTVTRCTLRGNGGPGLSTSGDLLNRRNRNHSITYNLVSANSQYGFNLTASYGTRVQHNQFGRQVHVTDPTSINLFYGQFIVTNNVSFGDNTFLTFNSALAIRGPIINTTGVLSDTGAASHPNANFHLAD